MHPRKRSLLWLNLVGGVAVLSSYAHGLLTHPDTRGDLWGDVPEALLPFYTANMFLAAAGYFAFGHFVLFRLDPERVRIGKRAGFGLFHLLYALILFPSALWMPLSFALLESPGSGLWLAVRLTLFLAGAASLGLFAAIARASPHDAPVGRRVALLGCGFFCLQTALLDALLWPAWFPVKG